MPCTLAIPCGESYIYDKEPAESEKERRSVRKNSAPLYTVPGKNLVIHKDVYGKENWVVRLQEILQFIMKVNKFFTISASVGFPIRSCPVLFPSGS